jgi:hypothetical protein
MQQCRCDTPRVRSGSLPQTTSSKLRPLQLAALEESCEVATYLLYIHLVVGLFEGHEEKVGDGGLGGVGAGGPNNNQPARRAAGRAGWGWLVAFQRPHVGGLGALRPRRHVELDGLALIQ